MGMRRSDDTPLAYEPMPIPETFVTGSLPSETIGELVRLTLFSDRMDGVGGTERIIVARLLLSKRTLGELATQADVSPRTRRISCAAN